MKQISVGIVGSGFIAELHMHAYRRVFGVDVEVCAGSCRRGDQVVDFARRFGIPKTHRDWRALFDDPDIDVIDICTPPALHARDDCCLHGRGQARDLRKAVHRLFRPPGRSCADRHDASRKSVMYERVMAEMEETRAAIRASGRLFLYAEDWVYAPAVAKIAEILKETQ